MVVMVFAHPPFWLNTAMIFADILGRPFTRESDQQENNFADFSKYDCGVKRLTFTRERQRRRVP
jgi:hypothetical protein